MRKSRDGFLCQRDSQIGKRFPSSPKLDCGVSVAVYSEGEVCFWPISSLGAGAGELASRTGGRTCKEGTAKPAWTQKERELQASDVNG